MIRTYTIYHCTACDFQRTIPFSKCPACSCGANYGLTNKGYYAGKIALPSSKEEKQ